MALHRILTNSTPDQKGLCRLETAALAIHPEALARVTHSARASAARVGLVSVSDTAAPARSRSPHGRWWRAGTRPHHRLRRVLAVASYADFHGEPWSTVQDYALVIARGDTQRAAWFLLQVRQQRPSWDHARRRVGRSGGIASAQARASRALAHRARALSLRAEGHPIREIMWRMGRSRRAVQYWLNTEPHAALLARAEAHAHEQRHTAAQRRARFLRTHAGFEIRRARWLRHHRAAYTRRRSGGRNEHTHSEGVTISLSMYMVAKSPEQAKNPTDLPPVTRKQPKTTQRREGVQRTNSPRAPTPSEQWRKSLVAVLHDLPPPTTEPSAWLHRCAVSLAKNGFSPNRIRTILGIDDPDFPTRFQAL